MAFFSGTLGEGAWTVVRDGGFGILPRGGLCSSLSEARIMDAPANARHGCCGLIAPAPRRRRGE
eukprot:1436195-Prymnesium_polylepis.1